MGNDSPAKRMSAEEEAYARGARDTALAFADLIDDCDRAMQALIEGSADPSIRSGVEGAVGRMTEHLARHGLTSILPLDQQFDPLFHEAIAVEPGAGRDGLIVRVHRRGWLLGEQLLRPAIVTVCQGTPDESEEADEEMASYQLNDEPATIEADGKRPRRRRSGGAIPGFIEEPR